MGPRPYGRTAFSMPQLADPTTPPPTIPIQTANVPVRGRYHRPPFAACLCLTPCYWLQLALCSASAPVLRGVRDPEVTGSDNDAVRPVRSGGCQSGICRMRNPIHIHPDPRSGWK